MGEVHAFTGEEIGARRLADPVAIGSQRVEALLVGEDEKYIGPLVVHKLPVSTISFYWRGECFQTPEGYVMPSVRGR